MARNWILVVAVALAALLVVAYPAPAAAQAPAPAPGPDTGAATDWNIRTTYSYQDTTNKLLPWQDSYVNGSITALVQTLPRKYNIKASDVALTNLTTNTTTEGETAVVTYDIKAKGDYAPLAEDLVALGDDIDPQNAKFTENLVKNKVPVDLVLIAGQRVLDVTAYPPPPPGTPGTPSAGTRASASFVAWLVVFASVFLSVAGALSLPL